jgi:septum formation protein
VTPVVLASKSPSRQAVLRAAGVVFEAVGSGVDEDAAKVGYSSEGLGPREVAERLALAKASAVSATRPEAIVIGADQTLDLDGVMFDKVETLDLGRKRLQQLRGKTHLLHSAIVAVQGGAAVWRHVESPRLSMREVSDAFIDAYLAKHGEALLSSVGIYQLENDGVQFFDAIEGDYFAILGLPLTPLLNLLRERGALAT